MPRLSRRLSVLALLALLWTPILFADTTDKNEDACGDLPELGSNQAAQGELTPSDRQLFLDRVITGLLEQHHYNAREFDDALAREVFDNYIDGIDPGRYYLARSDVEEFRNRHAEILNDSPRHGTGDRIALAFELFQRFQQRVDERVAFVSSYLEEEPSLDGEEQLPINREDAEWARDKKALDELWTRRIKNDVIGLVLADVEWEDIQDRLIRRYGNLQRTVGQSSRNDIFESFMNAHTHALDPHTAYFSPRNMEEFEIRMSLSLEGIGAALQSQDEYITITDILPGGPADKDGTLRPQDRITGVAARDECDIVDIIGWRVDDAVQLIRGPEGTRVRLRYLPADAVPGDPEKTIELVRSEVQLDQQAAQKEIKDLQIGDRDYRIGVIRLPAFYMDFQARREGREDYRSTTRDVRKLLAELKEEGVDGIVLDLRNNGGGSLVEATELAGVFLDDGPVVQLLDSRGNLEIADNPDDGQEWSGPLGVMVNRFSASASEIFAGVIQDYGRGVIIGSPTYGKGTIQNLLDLDRFSNNGDAGQLKFTVGKFYRVNGDSMQHRGVRPDIQFPSAVSLEDFGESTKENALPWDQIKTLEYAGEPLPESLIAALEKRHSDRAARDIDFSTLLDDIRSYREIQSRESISLNLEERREEQDRMRERRLTQENVRRAARGEAVLEEMDDDAEESGDPDVLLTESARIVADLAALLPEYAEHDGHFAARHPAELDN